MLTNIGWFVGIEKHPTRCNLLITNTGVCVIGSGVFTIIALGLKILIVETSELIIKPIRPIAPEPVITHPVAKPTF